MIDLNNTMPCCIHCEGLIEFGAEQCVIDKGLSEFIDLPEGRHLCFWCYHGLADELDELPQAEMRQ